MKKKITAHSHHSLLVDRKAIQHFYNATNSEVEMAAREKAKALNTPVVVMLETVSSHCPRYTVVLPDGAVIKPQNNTRYLECEKYLHK